MEQKKFALLNNDNVFGSVNIISLKYNDLWDLFTMSIFTSIKEGEYKGKECYILSFSKSDEIYTLLTGTLSFVFILKFSVFSS